MSEETPSSKIPYWHIANWPFYLRCSVAYLTCALISASFFVLTFMVNKNTGDIFTIAQSTLIASYLIAIWGALLFVPTTAIAEFFEIRNIGYYLLFGTLNSHGLLIYVTSRISDKAANATTVFEYMTSLLALLVCIAGVVLESDSKFSAVYSCDVACHSSN